MTPNRPFRKLSEPELQALSDDALIAYGRSAQEAGELDAARQALAFLVFGRMDDVRRRMRMRVPPEVADDLAHDAIVRAIGSAFSGTSQGEFYVWLGRIVERTAIDWFRRRDRRPKESTLPSEHAGDDDVWGAEPVAPDESSAVGVQQLIERALDELNPAHRQVVELHVFEDLDAAKTAERVDGMTPGNVAQIASRFRKRMRGLLDDGDTAS